jgi:hypothetical protein
MCVIVVAREVLPKAAVVEKMWEANPYGGGIAWVEDGNVFFEKGLELPEMHALLADLEGAAGPVTLHFRIPTVSGPLKDDALLLCHPFPVLPKPVNTELSGTAEAVLFHNGHWGNWREKLLDLVMRHDLELPEGPWSDSRALAFIASHFGPSILEIVDERVAYMTPRGVVQYGKWEFIAEDKLWVTNDHWKWSHLRGGHNQWRSGASTPASSASYNGLIPAMTEEDYLSDDYAAVSVQIASEQASASAPPPAKKLDGWVKNEQGVWVQGEIPMQSLSTAPAPLATGLATGARTGNSMPQEAKQALPVPPFSPPAKEDLPSAPLEGVKEDPTHSVKEQASALVKQLEQWDRTAEPEGKSEGGQKQKQKRRREKKEKKHAAAARDNGRPPLYGGIKLIDGQRFIQVAGGTLLRIP